MNIYYFVFIFLFLLLSNEFLRRYRLASWLFFVILPIVLLPFEIHAHPDYTFFQWLKTYSVAAGIFFILLCRFTAMAKKIWVFYFIWIAFSINILEAVILDLQQGDLLNYMNAIVGFLLILSLPGPRSMSVDNSKQWRDFFWDIPFTWILGYTFWNWVFTYMNFTPYSLLHAVMLTSALLIGFVNNKLWLQTRAFIFGIYLIIKLINESTIDTFVINNIYYPIIAEVFVGIAFALTTLNFYLNQRNSPQRISSSK